MVVALMAMVGCDGPSSEASNGRKSSRSADVAERTLEQRVENVERRVTSVEQILPTLATKADLEAAIAPLATKAELQAAIAPLATKAEVKAEAAETRRHFDIVAEGLRDDIRLIAEGLVTLQARVDAQHADVKAILDNHDRRLRRLEGARSKRPGG